MFKRTFFLKTGDTAAALFQHRELVCAFCRACKSGAIRFDEIMFPYVALTKDKAWQPGPYEGVELMILHKHESTGGIVVLRKFKTGHTVPTHTHPDANEWAYVLSGEWEESGITYTTGALFFAAKGVRHGPHVAHTEVISLTIFDGPLTVV
jgi:quercetin dioxygenase-like cupin family protein